MPFSVLGGPVSAILERFSSDAESQFVGGAEDNRRKRQEYEDILKKEEATGLITLVNFSKYELEQYYQIGLEQGKRSYKTSLVAMWIGFFILLLAIVLFTIPASGLFFNQGVPKTNVQILTLSSGIVSELIAGLFLWIYRSSKNQLTYFYNRQIFIHNSLLAYKIATTMDASGKMDAAKQVIIDKILAFGTVSSGIVPEGEPGESRRPKSGGKSPKSTPAANTAHP
ncbi:hypothetical protein GCM10011511_54000 [Puia dinghuensis]|uniref:Cyanobacterial TRADD-N associated 2 transmembrane domain-containing protein n=2 Tax=Puia dinghuensis TaxID=1792502 RepID=A0A8J2UIY4_9BACT|nr:hypothetical protein GCM10011511_54000 [Puia dinghuensis]